MKLYNVDLSPYAAAVRMAVYAKSLENEIEFVLPHDGDTKSAGYLAVNPIGKIPCLDTGHEVIPESSTINEYLEDKFPEVSLLPEGAEERARVRLVARLVDLYLYPGLSKLFQQSSAEAADPEVVQAGLEEVATSCGHIARYLAPEGFACGDRLTLADCALAPPLFYCGAVLPMFGADFSGPAAEYFARVAGQAPVDRVVGELKTALQERMAGG